MMFLELGLRTW